MPVDARAYQEERIPAPPPLPLISRKAMRRVSDAIPVPTTCRYCGGPVTLVNNAEIYGRSYGDWPFAYRCSPCDAFVGLHPLTDIPLGTLANKELREARKTAKAAFRAAQQRLRLKRTEMYIWLATQMGIDRDVCHFGWFEVDQCREARRICQENRYAEQ